MANKTADVYSKKSPSQLAEVMHVPWFQSLAIAMHAKPVHPTMCASRATMPGQVAQALAHKTRDKNFEHQFKPVKLQQPDQILSSHISITKRESTHVV